MGAGVRMPATTSSPCALMQVLPVKGVLARAGVSREGDARGAVGPHVSEDHGLDVDGRPPLVGDVLDATVGDRPLPIPRREDGADAAPELLRWVIGEVLPDDLPDLRLELLQSSFRSSAVSSVSFVDAPRSSFKRSRIRSSCLRMPWSSAGSIPAAFSITTSEYMTMSRRYAS